VNETGPEMSEDLHNAARQNYDRKHLDGESENSSKAQLSEGDSQKQIPKQKQAKATKANNAPNSGAASAKKQNQNKKQ